MFEFPRFEWLRLDGIYQFMNLSLVFGKWTLVRNCVSLTMRLRNITESQRGIAQSMVPAIVFCSEFRKHYIPVAKQRPHYPHSGFCFGAFVHAWTGTNFQALIFTIGNRKLKKLWDSFGEEFVDVRNRFIGIILRFNKGICYLFEMLFHNREMVLCFERNSILLYSKNNSSRRN